MVRWEKRFEVKQVSATCKIHVELTQMTVPAFRRRGGGENPADELPDELSELLSPAPEDEGETTEDLYLQLQSILTGNSADAPRAELNTIGYLEVHPDDTVELTFYDAGGTESAVLTSMLMTPQNTFVLLRGQNASDRSCMMFEKGSFQICDYGAKKGLPPVAIRTKDLNVAIGSNAGSVYLDYTVEIRGTQTEHNLLSVQYELDPDA